MKHFIRVVLAVATPIVLLAGHPDAIAQESPECSNAYHGVCIPPPPPDLDCADLPFTDFRTLPRDPHGLDPDGDGFGCENGAIPTKKALSPLYLAALVVAILLGGYYLRSRSWFGPPQSETADDEGTIDEEIIQKRVELERLTQELQDLRATVASSAEQERAIQRVLVRTLRVERHLTMRRETQWHEWNRNFTIALAAITTLGGVLLSWWLT